MSDRAATSSRFRRRYGSGPAHLVGLLVCFLVAGYAALRWLDSPLTGRLLVWFAAAVIGHDLVFFPLYSAADRLVRRGTRSRTRRVPLVNHVRVPLLLSALLLLLWFPLITGRPEPAYRAATGLDTSPYLNRWLLVTAALIAVSALLYVLRWLASSPRRGAAANSAIPSSNDTDASQPSS